MSSLSSVLLCFAIFGANFNFGVTEFTYKDHLKNSFEKTFHKKCDKYPFVQRYVNKLEHPDDTYLTFVYQEPGLRNGGLGDRLGGLITAVAIANRFNRTLLIKATTNEMYKVFRPYHPTDIHAAVPKYTWNNWTSWNHYNSKYEGNDATEMDIYDCINNGGRIAYNYILVDCPAFKFSNNHY